MRHRGSRCTSSRGALGAGQLVVEAAGAAWDAGLLSGSGHGGSTLGAAGAGTRSCEAPQERHTQLSRSSMDEAGRRRWLQWRCLGWGAGCWGPACTCASRCRHQPQQRTRMLVSSLAVLSWHHQVLVMRCCAITSTAGGGLMSHSGHLHPCMAFRTCHHMIHEPCS